MSFASTSYVLRPRAREALVRTGMAPAWRAFDEPAAGLSASLDHDPKVRAGQSDGNTPFVREFRRANRLADSDRRDESIAVLAPSIQWSGRNRFGWNRISLQCRCGVGRNALHPDHRADVLSQNLLCLLLGRSHACCSSRASRSSTGSPARGGFPCCPC